MAEKHSNPLSCSRAMEWLHLLIDTELSSADHEKLLAHLQTCERCRAAQRELSMIEAAHPQLDARLTAAPQNYFAALPQQVMTRIEKAEAARVQPRSVIRSVRAFDVREFIFGRTKYALAFAAVLALAFIVTRQLRGPEPSEIATTVMRQPASPSISRAESPAAEESSLQNETPSASAANSSRLDENPTTPSHVVADVDTNPSNAGPEFAAAAPSTREDIAQAADSEQMLSRAAIPFDQGISDSAANRSSLPVDALQLVNNPQGGRAEVNVEGQSVNRFDAAQESLALSRAPQPPATRALNVVALENEAATEGIVSRGTDTRLAQALRASAQATTQAERLKIWQSYFSYSRLDSASYNAAVENLARRLLAQSDSSVSVTQMQETLSFYQTMEKILASRRGQVAYDRERARLEELLNWKKSAQQ